MSETPAPRAPRTVLGINVLELAGGLILVALGAGVVAESLTYRLGSAANIGPGVFPMLLGLVLAGLGVAVIAEGRLSAATMPAVPWRALLAICAGLLAFAVLIDRAGAYIAIAALVVLSGLAERTFRPLTLAAITVALCLFVTAMVFGFRGIVNMALLPEL